MTYLKSILVLVLLISFAIIAAFFRPSYFQKENGVIQGVGCNGYSYEYDGEVTLGKKIHLVLSCDHTALTIWGAVNQKIQILDVDAVNGFSEIVDASVARIAIDTKSDFNFDGYNDISSLMSGGNGTSRDDGYFIFLYDPGTNQFIINYDLSDIPNISVDVANKRIVESHCDFKGDDTVCENTYYTWNNMGRLIQSVEGK